MLARFLEIYKFQGKEVAFERPEQLLGVIGLYNLTQITMRDAVKVNPSFKKVSYEVCSV